MAEILATTGAITTASRLAGELEKLGCQITVNGRVAVVEGGKQLQGAQVKATDLRAGACMVIAGLCASGVSEITDIRHIDRGYERIVEKLCALGADIKRVVE